MTDLTMPGLTGWDVARLVKVTHPRLPVVLVTGCAQTIPVSQPERTWMDAILPKPCGAAAMQAVIGALTRACDEVVCSGGPERVGLTRVRGGPTKASVSGTP